MVHLAIRKSMKLKEAASTKWLSRYKTVWGLLHTVLQPSLTSSLEVGLVGRNVGAQVCDSVGWAEVASLAWIEDTLPYSRVVWYWPGENANGWWTLCSTSIPFRYIWMNAKKPCLKMLLFHSLFFPFSFEHYSILSHLLSSTVMTSPTLYCRRSLFPPGVEGGSSFSLTTCTCSGLHWGRWEGKL